MATKTEAWLDKEGNLYGSEAAANYADDIAAVRLVVKEFVRESPLVNETDRINMVEYILGKGRGMLFVIATDIRRAMNGER